MPRSAPTTQVIPAAGAALVLTAPDALGDIVDVGTDLHVNNGSGASINVTVQSTVTVEGLALPHRVLAVAAGARAEIPIKAATSQRPAGGADPGKAYVDYSAVTSVTRAVIDHA